MSDSPQKSTGKSNKLMELMMTSVLQKHGITKESVKDKLTEEQKQTILELLDELNKQASELVTKSVTEKKNSK
jgi:spore coat protein W